MIIIKKKKYSNHSEKNILEKASYLHNKRKEEKKIIETHANNSLIF